MTHYLYAIPSFWGGAARALDLGSTLTVYNESSTGAPKQADFWAIKADWMSYGEGYAKRDRRFHRKTCHAQIVSKIYPVKPQSKLVHVTAAQSSFSGPLPPPEILEKYTKFTLGPQK